MTEPLAVYLEIGPKRTFAGAVEWPGWCRAGKNPDEALEALVAYAARYAKVVSRPELGFERPSGVEDLEVVERLKATPPPNSSLPGFHPRRTTSR